MKRYYTIKNSILKTIFFKVTIFHMNDSFSSKQHPGSSLGMSRRGTGMPPQKYYTVLSFESSNRFGFGSASPARPIEKFADTPGPGKYDPQPSTEHFESIRGHGNGFTSFAPRRLGFTRGNKNPAPVQYVQQYQDHRLKTAIGTIPRGFRCSCYQDEREASSTPGPGSYDLPSLSNRSVTSVFKSRSKRQFLPDKPKPPPRFQGNTFIIRRYE